MFHIARKQTLTAVAAVALSLSIALPIAASAADRYAYSDRGSEYDGYCYQSDGETGKGHPVTGAVVGGAIGSQVSKNEKGLGTVAGALLGAAVGSKVGKHKDNTCLNGDYYSYEGTYYEPAPAPDGYSVVFFRTRPSSDIYSNVHYNSHSRRDDRNSDYSYNNSNSNW